MHYSVYSKICKYIHKYTIMHFVAVIIIIFFFQSIDYTDLLHLCKVFPVFYCLGVP